MEPTKGSGNNHFGGDLLNKMNKFKNTLANRFRLNLESLNNSINKIISNVSELFSTMLNSARGSSKNFNTTVLNPHSKSSETPEATGSPNNSPVVKVTQVEGKPPMIFPSEEESQPNESTENDTPHTPSPEAGRQPLHPGENGSIKKKQNSSGWSLDSKDNLVRIKMVQSELKETSFEIKEALGSGAVGNVSSIKPEQGKAKAAKISNGINGLEKEIEITSKWEKNSVGLVSHKAYISDKNREILIMSKYDGKIQDLNNKLTPQVKIEAIFQLGEGLTTLHRLGITHGDLHTGNILYSIEKNRFDIADFNLSIVTKLDDSDDMETFNYLKNVDVKDFKEIIRYILLDGSQDLHIDRNHLENLGYSEQTAIKIIQCLENEKITAEQIKDIFKEIRNEF